MGTVEVGLLPETVIEERAAWTLAVNRNQNLLGKCMVVLRRPCTAVTELEADEWAALRDELRRLVPALERLFRPDQVNHAFLMNEEAQVHLHVVPRYAGPRLWRGRSFADEHWGRVFGGEPRILPLGELQQLADDIRAALRG
jgi:diadenosine tetraphosphate (Ap4A) HIT family hydrolase